MLKQLRNKKTARKIWIILAAIIVPAFVLWGSGSMGRSQRASGTMGKLFGKNVTAMEYTDALEAVKNQAIMQFGDKFAEVQKYLNFQNQAWERIVLLQEAKKRRIKADDREVITLIQSYPFFQKKNRFDERLYEEMLKYVFRSQAREFEEHTRQNIILSKLYGIIAKDVFVNDEEVKNSYRRENEQVSISYLSSAKEDFVKEIHVTDEELADYFAKNQLQFKQPLSFNIAYVTLDSEEQVRTIFPKIKREKDFTIAAKQLNLELKETGLFAQTDPIPGIGWAPHILTLLAKLNNGEYAPPINADKNFYLIQLKEKKDPYIPEFNAIKEKVKEAFVKNKSETLAQEKVEQCLAKLKAAYLQDPKSADFEKTAKECGAKFGSTVPFKFDGYLEGIGQADALWLAATNAKEDAFSDIVTMPSGYYIVKLKSRVSFDEKKFQEEKKEFSKKVLEQKKQEAFNNYIEDLKRKSQLF